jgi:endonuclease G
MLVLWNRVVEKIRYWADKYTALFIVTGSILRDQLRTIGDEKVSVPDYVYKLAVRVQNDALVIIPFLISNERSDSSLYHFAAAINNTEAITGINFNTKLLDKIAEKIKKELSYKKWNFS